MVGTAEMTTSSPTTSHRRHTRPATPSRSRLVARLVVSVLSWSVIIGISAVLVVSVLIPRLGGGQAYTVLTGSMKPHLPPGTMVVTKSVDPRDIGVGTVITYQLESGRSAVVTHRVVTQGLNADGEPIWWTQGDANNARDQNPVRPVQVRGAYWYSVPYLGYAGTYVPGNLRGIGVLLAAAALVGYALTMFVSADRDRRKRRQR